MISKDKNRGTKRSPCRAAHIMLPAADRIIATPLKSWRPPGKPWQSTLATRAMITYSRFTGTVPSIDALEHRMTASSDAVYRMSRDWSEMSYLEGRNFVSDTNGSNKSWLERYISPDDQPQVLEIIDKAIRNKSIFELGSGPSERMGPWAGPSPGRLRCWVKTAKLLPSARRFSVLSSF